MTDQTRATAAVVDFVASTSFADIPSEALDIGRRCDRRNQERVRTQSGGERH